MPKQWPPTVLPQISELAQGNFDITGYYSKLKRLWDDLDSLDACQHCTCDGHCGGKVDTLKSQQDGRLLQFLMGLNDSYFGPRSILLMLSPLPFVNHAYSLLIRMRKGGPDLTTPWRSCLLNCKTTIWWSKIQL